MQDEAEITINCVKLTDTESMTVRVAIDTLANVLAEALEEQEGREFTDVYIASLSRIQSLLESRKTRHNDAAREPPRIPKIERYRASGSNAHMRLSS